MLPRFAHFDDDCEDTADPMNILFLEQTASGLERTLHGITNAEKNKKWKKPSYMGFATARDQWLHISGDCRVQDEQCVVGACHHEDLITIGGNPRLPRPHYPTSFDTGKNTICEDFRTAGRLVTPAALPMRNNLNDPACDGNAALIG
jgi:hypothetical protein